VMTMPAYTVPPGRLGGEVLFEMLERGIQHAPVVSERGRLVGVGARSTWRSHPSDCSRTESCAWPSARRREES
jgi:hypothetical protein